jgi:hypothetical protein
MARGASASGGGRTAIGRLHGCLSRHGHRDGQAVGGGTGPGVLPPGGSGGSRRGVHRHPVPDSCPGGSGGNRRSGRQGAPGGRDGTVPAGRDRRPVVSGSVPLGGGGVDNGPGRFRPGGKWCAVGRMHCHACSAQRARPGGRRADRAGQRAAAGPGPRGHPRVRAAILVVRTGPRAVPGQPDAPGGGPTPSDSPG